MAHPQSPPQGLAASIASDVGASQPQVVSGHTKNWRSILKKRERSDL